MAAPDIWDLEMEAILAAERLGHRLTAFEDIQTEPRIIKAACTVCGAEVRVSDKPGTLGWLSGIMGPAATKPCGV